MNGLLILILIVVAAVFLFKDCKVRCCPSENYAGQTFASRAGGVAGPCPNYFRHVDYGSMVGCGPSETDYDSQMTSFEQTPPLQPLGPTSQWYRCMGNCMDGPFPNYQMCEYNCGKYLGSEDS